LTLFIIIDCLLYMSQNITKPSGTYCKKRLWSQDARPMAV